MIEPKGVDPFSVRNCIHLLMSSNADWVVPAGADARRYFVLDVSDAQMQVDFRRGQEAHRPPRSPSIRRLSRRRAQVDALGNHEHRFPNLTQPNAPIGNTGHQT